MEKEKVVKWDRECWGFRVLGGVVREGLLENESFEPSSLCCAEGMPGKDPQTQTGFPQGHRGRAS